ncbi:MAG: hypothetical protein OEV99_13365 [Nitrospira sp.]|nr:hypothetical protein [Nitrospira sp.]MDH5347589.1 hypothetical protein [Nitrospira sp.]MDH5498357.1 hypothetical protein [Nitrospira sp.]
MPSNALVVALHTPGHLRFPSARALAERFDEIGGYVETFPTGHLVFYRPDGRRFLATDPVGHPLHECEWGSTEEGTATLTRARVRLDWDRWVGIKPCGLVHETKLNLAARPNWQRITPDDLRAMAAGALRVPMEEVRWFYRDEDFSIDPQGTAIIRQRKDALYILDDGGFDQARFMSCMGAMHWGQIDFLPVVELFKSLLPGTGSAVFELIRGLYDDQNKDQTASRPLRYRGIPTYPSEAAFRLFSNFFTPQGLAGGNPLADFMNPSKSHVMTWLPALDPPVRYVADGQGLCVTVQGGVIQKATLEHDTAGFSYIHPGDRRVLPLDRSLRVEGSRLILRDREKRIAVSLPVGIELRPSSAPEYPLSSADWRTVFVQGVPEIRPAEAFEAVPLYPENDEEIGELAAQPFVADYLDDLGEQDREIGRLRSQAERVLIDNGDAAIATCILFDRPRDYTVHVRHAAFAQRQAQQLWTQCAAVKRWDWLHRIRMVAAVDEPRTGEHQYDLGYCWLPYDSFGSPASLLSAMARLRERVRPNGHVFVVGPAELGQALAGQQWELCWDQSVATLPTFRMHKTILPKARVKSGLTLFHVRRG